MPFSQRLQRLSAANLRVIAQGRRYTDVVAWMVRDSIQANRPLWMRIVIATLASLAANAISVAVIYLYVRLLERNTELHLFGMTILPQESSLLLGGTVFTVVLVLLLFSVSSFLARSASISLARHFEERSILQVLRLSRHLPDPRAERADAILATTKLIQIATQNPRYNGMSIRMIANAVPALFMFVFAFAVLFYLDASTTVAVSAMGLIAVAAQYPPNLFAATAGATFFDSRVGFRQGINALITRIERSPRTTTDKTLQKDIDSFITETQTVRHLSAFEDRFRATELSGLAMQVSGALVLAVMLFVIGEALIRRGADWASLIAYIAMLRVVLSSLTTMSRAVASVSRFYPHIQEHLEFITSASRAAEPMRSAADASGPASFSLQAKPCLSAKASERVELHSDDLHGLLAGAQIEPSALRALQRAAKPAQDATPTKRMPYIDLIADTEPEIGIVPPTTEADSGTNREGSKVSDPLIERIITSPGDIILIERAAIDTIGSTGWSHCRRSLANRILVICYKTPSQRLCDLEETVLIVVDKSDHFHWTPVPPARFDPKDRKSLEKLAKQTSTVQKAAHGDDDLLD